MCNFKVPRKIVVVKRIRYQLFFFTAEGIPSEMPREDAGGFYGPREHEQSFTSPPLSPVRRRIAHHETYLYQLFFLPQGNNCANEKTTDKILQCSFRSNTSVF
jgi:hypothetical protein